MVRLDEDLENIPPAERIKILRQRAEQRKKELEDLERKKKEEVEKELAEFENTIRELYEEEEQKFREEEEKKKKQEAEARNNSLEETLEESAHSQNIPVSANENYMNPALFSGRGNVDVYDLTNYNIYNKIKELSSKADASDITSEERNFLSGVSYHINRIQREQAYTSSQDPQGYISRTSGLIKEMEKKWGL